MRCLAVRGLGVAAALWAVALTGCGIAEPVEDIATGSVSQAVERCLGDEEDDECGIGYTCYCNTGYCDTGELGTCGRGCSRNEQCGTGYTCGYDRKCHKRCEPGVVPSGCATGEQCCLGRDHTSSSYWIWPHCATACYSPEAESVSR